MNRGFWLFSALAQDFWSHSLKITSQGQIKSYKSWEQSIKEHKSNSLSSIIYSQWLFSFNLMLLLGLEMNIKNSYQMEGIILLRFTHNHDKKTAVLILKDCRNRKLKPREEGFSFCFPLIQPQFDWKNIILGHGSLTSQFLYSINERLVITNCQVRLRTI